MTEFGENQDPYIGFRETVRQLMEEQGLSQNAVATAMGMDTSHLNRILRGMRNPPSSEKVVALAQVLGMNKETTDNLAQQYNECKSTSATAEIRLRLTRIRTTCIGEPRFLVFILI